jgi:hypothetical protein
MKRLLLASTGTVAFSLVLGLTACGGSAVQPSTPPPVTQQSVDHQLAGWLLTAQTAIEQAKSLVATNPGIKDPLNRIIASYNTAESGYLIYHQAVVSGASTDATALTAQINQLVQNVSALVALYTPKP